MLSVAEAEKIILNLIHPFNSEQDSELIEISQGLQRILATDIYSNWDLPHWHSAAMDGYALHYADLVDLELNLEACQFAIAPTAIAAGHNNQLTLGNREAMRIFTGGMMPLGADTVIMQEDTEVVMTEAGKFLKLKAKPTQGEYVRRQGEYIKAGDKLLGAGTRLGATEIGAIAAIGQSQVRVLRQPKVAIISTGDELVSLASFAKTAHHHGTLASGQIIDSNLHALAALVTQAGAIAIPLGTVADDRQAMRELFQRAIAEADLIISSGGVSVGDYDHVEQLLESLGADIHGRSVAIKPGKPLTVATISKPAHRPIICFGLPGNPASAMICFWRFIRGAIAKLNGANPREWVPQFIQAHTTQDLHSQGRRETYLWGELTYVKGKPLFAPKQNYSSGNLVSITSTKAIAVMRVHQTYVPQGDQVLVMVI